MSIHVAEDNKIIVSATLDKLQARPNFEVEVQADWKSGDAVTLRLVFLVPHDDGLVVELDDCLPVEHIPEATFNSDVLFEIKKDGTDDVFGEIVSNILARTADLKLTYDKWEHGVVVSFTLGAFKTEAIMDLEEAGHYFVLPK